MSGVCTSDRRIARGLEVGGTTCSRQPDAALPAAPFPNVTPSLRIPLLAFRSIACFRPPNAAAQIPKRSRLHSLARLSPGKCTDSPDYGSWYRRSPWCSCPLIGCLSTSALAGPCCRRQSNRSRSTICSAAVRIAAAHASPQGQWIDHSLPWPLGYSIRP